MMSTTSIVLLICVAVAVLLVLRRFAPKFRSGWARSLVGTRYASVPNNQWALIQAVYARKRAQKALVLGFMLILLVGVMYIALPEQTAVWLSHQWRALVLMLVLPAVFLGAGIHLERNLKQGPWTLWLCIGIALLSLALGLKTFFG